MKTSSEFSANNSNSKENTAIHKLNEVDKKKIIKQKLIDKKIYKEEEKRRELIFNKYIKEQDTILKFYDPLYDIYYKYKKYNRSHDEPKLFHEILLESINLNGLGNKSNCIRLEKGKVWFVIKYKGKINFTILNFKNGKELFSFETKSKIVKVAEIISKQLEVEDSGNYFVYITSKNKWKMLITEENNWKGEERRRRY